METIYKKRKTTAEYSREWRERNLEKAREACRKNYHKHKEERKAYYQKHKDKIKTWRKKWSELNADRLKDKSKKYREENKERIAKYYREWYAKNGRNRSEASFERSLEWAQENPEKVAIQRKLRHKIRQGKILRPETCPKCGVKAKIQAHHYNYEHYMNFIWLCSSCHKKEHVKKIS